MMSERKTGMPYLPCSGSPVGSVIRGGWDNVQQESIPDGARSASPDACLFTFKIIR